MSYFRWTTANDVLLHLLLVSSDGTGLTGSDPVVAIRRVRTVAGAGLDGYFWNSASFVSAATFLTMSEYDATNNPGLYHYTFSQSLEQNENVYNMFYQHNSTPVGIVSETHDFVLVVSGSSGSSEVRLYESEPAIR